MKIYSLFFYFGILLLVVNLSFSCEKNQDLKLRDNQPFLDSVNFEFRLLTEQGIPSTIFKAGDNFIFSFLIINKSNQKFMYLQGIDDRDNFFRVDAINTNPDEVDGQLIDLGKPWKTMFCEYKAGLLINARDTLALEIPWNTRDLEPGDPYYSSLFCLLEDYPNLGVGKYRTGFSSTFSFVKGEDKFESEKMDFNIEFEILQ